MLRRICAAVVIAAGALSFGCGQTCKCDGDPCTGCSGNTPAAPALETGTHVAGDATTDVTLPDATGDGAGSSDSNGSAAYIDAGGGYDSGGANDGGAECITGCSRGMGAC